jgi:cytochrome oxidase assembly protein ShyY1
VPSTLRLATTPRWIALGLIALVFGAGALFLGRWQWDRTQDIIQAEQAARAEPVAIETLTAVGEDFDNPLIGRPVLADGRYDAAKQTLVLNRERDGRPGFWVLTPLLLGDGSAIAVLRGWTDNPTQAVPEVGTVAVAGIWHPNERFYRDEPFDDAGVYAISSERLRERWDVPLRPGFIMLTTQSPESTLPPVPQTVRTADVPFPIQNAFYAIQWLVFAGFAGFVYFRWLRMEARSNLTS